MDADQDRFVDLFFAAFALAGKSAETVRAYRNDLRQYKVWVTAIAVGCSFQSVTVQQAKNYRTCLVEKYPSVTASRKLSAVRTFYEWLLDTKHVAANPFASVQVHRDSTEVTARRALTDAEFNAIMSKIPVSEPHHRRDRAVYRVLHECRGKIQSILSCRMIDYDQLTGALDVAGKIVVLSELARAEIRAYLSDREPAKRESPLFRNKHGGRISARSIRRQFASYAKTAAVAGVSPGSFSVI